MKWTSIALALAVSASLAAQGSGNNRDLHLQTSFAGGSLNAAAKYMPAAGDLFLRATSPLGTQSNAPLLIAFDLRGRTDVGSVLALPNEPDALGLGLSTMLLLDGSASGYGIISVPATVGAQGWSLTVPLPDFRLYGSPSLRIAALTLDSAAPNGLAISKTLRHDVEAFSTQTLLSATEYAPSSIMGYGTECADVNGDGVADVLAGVPCADPYGVTDAGEVRVYLGPSLSLSYILRAPQPQAQGWFGNVVRTGDVTGDGFVDILVGARQEDVNGVVDAGRVYVFAGPQFTSVSVLTAPMLETGARIGHALCTTDWNGDGIQDIAVGSPKSSVGLIPQAGNVHIFAGGTFAWLTSIANPTPTDGAKFGYALAGGDLNGDGLGDLASCVPYHDVGVADDTGGVAIYFAPSTSPAIFYTQPVDVGAVLGDAIARGDLNGDGFMDLVVGAEFDDAAALDAGSVHVLLGPSFTALMEITSPEASVLGGFGSDVALGDVNRDGFLDIVAGEFYADPLGLVDAGQAWVAFGPEFVTRVKSVAQDVHAGANAGRRVAVGDTNGDGFADMVFGAPLADPFGPVNNNEGAIYISR
jgi:hypothetical protein